MQASKLQHQIRIWRHIDLWPAMFCRHSLLFSLTHTRTHTNTRLSPWHCSPCLCWPSSAGRLFCSRLCFLGPSSSAWPGSPTPAPGSPGPPTPVCPGRRPPRAGQSDSGSDAQTCLLFRAAAVMSEIARIVNVRVQLWGGSGRLSSAAFAILATNLTVKSLAFGSFHFIAQVQLTRTLFSSCLVTNLQWTWNRSTPRVLLLEISGQTISVPTMGFAHCVSNNRGSYSSVRSLWRRFTLSCLHACFLWICESVSQSSCVLVSTRPNTRRRVQKLPRCITSRVYTLQTCARTCSVQGSLQLCPQGWIPRM